MQLHQIAHVPTVHASAPLRRGQIATVAALSIAFWLLAAVFIRYAAPVGVFGATASAPLFAATIPAAWLLVETIAHAAKLKPAQLIPGVALGSATALLCDGVAMTWTPRLYGADLAGILPAAAWLL